MMRLLSRQSPVYMVAVLALVTGLSACSKSDEQSENTTASQVTPPRATQAQSAVQALPTYSPQNTAKTVTKQQDTRQLAPAFVPAPLSREQQLRVERERAANKIESDYTCKNGTRFKAVFTRSPKAVSITFPGRVTVTLPQKGTQSTTGFMYESDQYAFRGSGPFAKWIMKGRDPVDCTVTVYEATQ